MLKKKRTVVAAIGAASLCAVIARAEVSMTQEEPVMANYSNFSDADGTPDLMTHAAEPYSIVVLEEHAPDQVLIVAPDGDAAIYEVTDVAWAMVPVDSEFSQEARDLSADSRSLIVADAGSAGSPTMTDVPIGTLSNEFQSPAISAEYRRATADFLAQAWEHMHVKS